MEQILVYLEKYQIIVAVILFLFGANYLPILKKIAELTPTTLDDAVVRALENCIPKKVLVPELATKLSKEEMVELVRIWKERHR